MKKNRIFLVGLFVFVLLGCSLFNFGSSFSPPTWIQGTWQDSLETTAYTFTADNVTQTIAGYTLNLGLVSIAGTVTETSNDSLYEFTIDQSGAAATYSFAKTSSTTLDYTVTASETTSPAVELTKQ